MRFLAGGLAAMVVAVAFGLVSKWLTGSTHEFMAGWLSAVVFHAVWGEYPFSTCRDRESAS